MENSHSFLLITMNFMQPSYKEVSLIKNIDINLMMNHLEVYIEPVFDLFLASLLSVLVSGL